MAGQHHFCRIVVLTVALLGFGSAAAPAQTPISEQRVASPPLPPGHWAVEAARRAEALGLATEFLPSQTAVPRHVITQILLRAAEAAGSDLPHMEPVAKGWVRRFEEEFVGLSSPASRQAVHNLGSSVEARVADRSGAVIPGQGIFPFGHTGAAPAPEGTAVEGALSVAAGIGSHLSVAAEPGLRDDGFRVSNWEARAGWRNLGFSVGRQPIGYGYRPASGLVLSGVEPIDRVQFETLAPFRLPGFFSRLGRISVHGFGGRLDGPRHPGDPYMWGASGTLQPHPRVTFSLNRAAIIGGDSVVTPLTPRTFLRTFVGHNLLGFENEVVAGGVRVRLPTERLIPLTVYTEWGAEDAAGAWRDVPGRLYGVYVPAVPGIPQAALGAEYVSFAGSCCGNPPWYRHIPHTGGWVKDEHPLGHPLGGQGRQATVFGSADLMGARLRLNGQAFARTREGENLFVPGREGRSTGASLGAALRVQARSDIRLDAFRESGAGWSEHAAAFGVRAFF